MIQINKDTTYYVVEKGTNIVQLIAPNEPFMGDENASRFKVNKMNKDFPDSYGYEFISISEYENKYEFTKGDTSEQK